MSEALRHLTATLAEIRALMEQADLEGLESLCDELKLCLEETRAEHDRLLAVLGRDVDADFRYKYQIENPPDPREEI